MNFDLNFLQGVAETAEAATGAFGKIGEAIISLKGAAKPAEGRSDAEIEAAIAQVTLAVDNARSKNLLLDAQVALLAERVRKANEAQAQLDRYQLWETPTGHLVYRLRDAQKADDPAHFICPNCYEDGRRSVLQGDWRRKKCQTCKSLFTFADDSWPQAPEFSRV